MTDRHTVGAEAPPIPFTDLQAQRDAMRTELDQAIARVLAHGQFILGPEVRALEDQLAEWSGATNVISCSSGTDALLMPLMAWGIGPGDAVFVPSFTFTATAEVVALLGATPVFCDVLPESFNLDAASLCRAIEFVSTRTELRPRAVIPVDLFGQPADYRVLDQVGEEAGIRVLADAAQSFGATLDGRPVGSLGEVTATSFFPAKPLGAFGDGGAIFTDDDDLARVMSSLRTHGQGSDKYDTVRVGLNARLDTLQAAVLLVKLAHFERELALRHEVAQRYGAAMSDAVAIPSLMPGATSAWTQYTLRVDQREDFRATLQEAGVPTAVYYPRPLHEQPAFEGAVTAPGGCPVAESLSREVVSLPMGPYLREEQQDRVSSAVRRAVGRPAQGVNGG